MKADDEEDAVEETTEVVAGRPDPEMKDELYLLAITVGINDPLDTLLAGEFADEDKPSSGRPVDEIDVSRDAAVTDNPS